MNLALKKQQDLKRNQEDLLEFNLNSVKETTEFYLEELVHSPNDSLGLCEALMCTKSFLENALSYLNQCKELWDYYSFEKHLQKVYAELGSCEDSLVEVYDSDNSQYNENLRKQLLDRVTLVKTQVFNVKNFSKS